MEIGISLQMMFPLAAQESIAGNAVEIEPVHLFCGALKLVEIPSLFLHEALPDKGLVAKIEEDQQNLNQILNEYGVSVPEDSTALRRGLRSLLRKEKAVFTKSHDGLIHRSATAKELFSRAEEAAIAAGEKELSVSRLIALLLKSPDEVLAGAFAKIGHIQITAKPQGDKMLSSWIDEFGCDLTGRASIEKVDNSCLEIIRRDAVNRVLVEVLFNKTGVTPPRALLVARGERLVSSVLEDIAIWLVSPKPPNGVRGGCILEIFSAVILNREGKGSPEARLEQVFQNISESQSKVLFFNDFHSYLTPVVASESLSRRFQTLLNNTKTACVMGMTLKQYEQFIEKSATWRKYFKIIWVHDAIPNFQL